jgi:DHA1 family bicyclomycin/chloramphenicol resistance-like MFS transporter
VFLAAAFNTFLSGVDLALVDVYGYRDHYAFILSLLMILPALAGLANGAVIERFGLPRMVGGVLVVYLAATMSGVIGSVLAGGAPGFGLFIAAVVPALTCHGTVQANFSSIALVPMGGNAGTAAAIIGTLATAGGVVGGFIASQFYDGTTQPLILAFFVCGLAAWLITSWARKDRDLPSVREVRGLESPAPIVDPRPVHELDRGE